MGKTFLIVATLTFMCAAVAQAGPVEDLEGVYDDPAGFDGGPGSTLNDPPPVETAPVPGVPDVGPVSPVGTPSPAEDEDDEDWEDSSLSEDLSDLENELSDLESDIGTDAFEPE
jgi:hypothetical protein